MATVNLRFKVNVPKAGKSPINVNLEGIPEAALQTLFQIGVTRICVDTTAGAAKQGWDEKACRERVLEHVAKWRGGDVTVGSGGRPADPVLDMLRPMYARAKGLTKAESLKADRDAIAAVMGKEWYEAKVKTIEGLLAE